MTISQYNVPSQPRGTHAWEPSFKLSEHVPKGPSSGVSSSEHMPLSTYHKYISYCNRKYRFRTVNLALCGDFWNVILWHKAYAMSPQSMLTLSASEYIRIKHQNNYSDITLYCIWPESIGFGHSEAFRYFSPLCKILCGDIAYTLCLNILSLQYREWRNELWYLKFWYVN